MRVGLAGCGVIGRRRAEVVCRSEGDQLVVVADVDRARAEDAAGQFHCQWTTDWRQVVGRPDLDVVIVSTTNDWLAPITVAALRHGRHVLCEKPPGRNASEARQMVEAAQDGGRLLKTGFNHRHHPAVAKAHELFRQGAIGEIFLIRCRYGHGGRPGYEKEWRLQRQISGGGELLDQGIHAIDLFRWFLGEFAEVTGFTATYFWGASPDSASFASEDRVEDSAFVLLRTARDQVASLHASWVQWKNTFCFEVFGGEGYLAAFGLGGGYGPERLVWGRRRPESGPPVERRFEFSGPDRSWELEWREFRQAIRENRQPLGSGYDGWQAMLLIDALYRKSRTP